jgi:TRAP-type mannitol/chloroaromatic compound transport system permease small subunit
MTQPDYTFRIAEWLTYNSTQLLAMLEKDKHLYNINITKRESIEDNLMKYAIEHNKDIPIDIVYAAFDDERVKIIMDMYFFKDLTKH